MISVYIYIYIYIYTTLSVTLLLATWNVMGLSDPTLSPNQMRAAFRPSNIEMKAMRLAAMLATRGTAKQAPDAAASIKLFSGL